MYIYTKLFPKLTDLYIYTTFSNQKDYFFQEYGDHLEGSPVVAISRVIMTNPSATSCFLYKNGETSVIFDKDEFVSYSFVRLDDATVLDLWFGVQHWFSHTSIIRLAGWLCVAAQDRRVI